MTTLRKLQQKIKAGWLQEFCREAAWVGAYIKRYRAVVAVHILLGVLAIVMSLGTSVASKYLIDAVTGHKTGTIGAAAAAMAGMLLLGILLKSVTSRVGAKLNVRVQNEIQAEAYEKILGADWQLLEQYRAGDLLNRLTSDIGTVCSGVTSLIPGLFSGLMQFFGALVIMLYFDSTMAAIALISVPVAAVSSRVLVRSMRLHNKRMKEISSDVMSFYEDSLNNLTSIKAFGVSRLFWDRMLGEQKRYTGEYLDYNRFSVRTSACLSLMGAVVSAACFGWGVYRLWSGHITYGSLTMFLQLSSTLRSAFSSLVSLVSSAISISTSAGRVMAIAELPKEPQAALEFSAGDRVSLRLMDCSFAYQGKQPVLKHIAFHAEPDELVALTGPSGEGKTTMLRLLLGLIQPQEGTAELQTGAEWRPLCAATRSAFAYVPQGNSMFAGTIRENLLLTRPDASEDELNAALETACAAGFVRALPEGLDYRVGSRGKGLSEGQAQRLAIARALLRRAPVLLLDEATSALDAQTEKQLLQNLMACPFVRTCVFVTHRAETARICRRRYHLQAGELREEL